MRAESTESDFFGALSCVLMAASDLRYDNDEAEQREMLRRCSAHEQYDRDRMAAFPNDRR